MHGEMTRRQAIQGLAALAPAALATTPMAARALAGGGTAGSTAAQAGEIGPYASDVLPTGVRSPIAATPTRQRE